jgi:ABC-type nickel/cobalt efflux system permease component RcnA
MFRWSWLLACLAFAVFASLIPREAQAHPLGNFTINHYSRLVFADEKARIDYVLDFAEIPTFQQKRQLDPNEDGKLSDAEAQAYLDAKLPSLVENLHLRVGKEDLLLRVLDSSAEYRPGQGGLPILRIEARLLADLPKDWEDHGAGHYTDRTYENRLGWREIVVKGGPGVAIKGSTAPSSGVSDELRKYPSDMLSSPLDVREATFKLVPGEGSVADGPVGEAARNYSTSDYSFKSNGYISKLYAKLNSLISFTSPSPTVILISLLAALLWGALHAFTPGHGKSVVAAYLIGDRGTAWHAAFLGLTVTLTHTLGVFVLGGVAIYLSRYILPEALFPWLSVVSGLLVVVIGLSLLFSRSRGLFGTGSGKARHTKLRHADGHHTHSHDGHDHSHAYAHVAHSHSHGGHEHSHERGHSAHSHGDHEHTHSHGGHTHTHLPPGVDGSKAGMRSLVALGVSGGLVPCPAALVLLLSAISLGRLGFGMVLVVVFSMGLAVVLTGIGLLMVYARRLFERYSFEARIPRFLPVASATAISFIGLVIVLGAISQTGLF